MHSSSTIRTAASLLLLAIATALPRRRRLSSSGARVFAGGCLLSALLLTPLTARGNGAFPDSLSLMAPAGDLDRLVLATNFGLISSENAAAPTPLWTWICELPTINNAGLYQMGPVPRRRLFAIADGKLAFSDDRGCAWKTAAGLVEQAAVVDAFPDLVSSDRVWVVAAHKDDGGSSDALYLSRDGGNRFEARLFQAAPGDVITGVESARANPSTIYATLSRATPQGFVPGVVSSHDEGTTWEPAPLTGLGAGSVRLIAVDPLSPSTLFLRWRAQDGERFALSTDGGNTAHPTLSLPGGIFTAYAMLDDHRAFLAGVLGSSPVLYESEDGGQSWRSLDGAPHIRALAGRGTTLYAATDNVVDGFAVAASTDAAGNWTPLLRFEDVQAVATCARVACATACQTEADLSVWSEDVCRADVQVPVEVDAGARAKDGGQDAPGDALASADGGGRRPAAQGCECALPHTGSGRGLPGWTPAVALLLWFELRRRRVVQLARDAPAAGARRAHQQSQHCEGEPAQAGVATDDGAPATATSSVRGASRARAARAHPRASCRRAAAGR